MEEKMEEKEMANVRKVTGELIGGYILYGIVYGILYSFVYSMISKNISSDNLILTAIVAILLQGITAYFVWKSSISSTFKKRVMEVNDVPKVIKNLIIFTVIICLISFVLNFVQIERNIEQEISSDPTIRIHESYMSSFYDEEQIAEYEAEKAKMIEDAMNQAYVYLIVLNVGLLVVYIGAILLHKKTILKHAV